MTSIQNEIGENKRYDELFYLAELYAEKYERTKSNKDLRKYKRYFTKALRLWSIDMDRFNAEIGL